MALWLLLTLMLVSCAKSHKKTDANLAQLADQVRLLQHYAEEVERASGQSGVKTMRRRIEGTQPYHGTHGGDHLTYAAMHDHADYPDTLGMGEIFAILNGVNFKTRHNDYMLYKRGNVGAKFDDTVPINFPDVPPSVLNKPTLAAQIKEMRKYFKAFAEQDPSIANYKPYFKANLCYLQGAWTFSDFDEIQEAFFSERHWYDAHSWDDLTGKNLFEAQTGSQSNLENFAHMPRRLWEVKSDGELVYAQWNYKILCHPLQDDLPLNRLRGVDDLKTRMQTGMTYENYLMQRNARFQINPFDRDVWAEELTEHGFLDTLMEQIPGPDGYGAYLEDTSYGRTLRYFDSATSTTKLNAAYFHRWYLNQEKGAMGVEERPRGFNDPTAFFAMTTQPNVAPSKVSVCDENGENCVCYEQRWVYAFPMEIIYTTPLIKWNPHEIEYKGFFTTEYGNSIYIGPTGAETRDGSPSMDGAYNGTNSHDFYQTPFDFFTGSEYGEDPADTPEDFLYVLDKYGNNYHKVRPSGIRTILLEIPGVGLIRERYPIHPMHSEGSPVGQELAAIREIIMNPTLYANMIRNP